MAGRATLTDEIMNGPMKFARAATMSTDVLEVFGLFLFILPSGALRVKGVL